MTRKLTTLFAASAILAGLGTATAVLAEGSTPRTQPPQHGTGMMGDHSGMMNMMGQMSPEQMKQMTDMMDNCNRMMEGMTTAPSQKAAPGSKG
jgi:Spy/CpxP family protein refolding chaperone